MPLAAEQVPEYARVWSWVFFGIGIAALMFSFRRTIRVVRVRNQASSNKYNQQIAQAKSVIDGIASRDLFEKHRRALTLDRRHELSESQRRRLRGITSAQARRRVS